MVKHDPWFQEDPRSDNDADNNSEGFDEIHRFADGSVFLLSLLD